MNDAADGTTLQAIALTPEAFAPYGTVVSAFPSPDTPGASAPPGAFPINEGTTWRLDVLRDLDLQRAGGSPGLAVYSASARRFPMALTVMERHQLGSQGFFPLTGARFVLVVAAAGPGPEGPRLRAFVTTGQQGVVLHPGTWHHALIAVESGSFAVMERFAAADGTPPDCDLAKLGTPVWLTLDHAPG